MLDKIFLANILKNARSWADVHAGLAEHGLKYVRKGGGAVIVDHEGNETKASSVGRPFSLFHMEKRFGILGDGNASVSWSVLGKEAREITNLRMLILDIVKSGDSEKSLDDLKNKYPDENVPNFARRYAEKLGKGKKVKPVATTCEMWLRKKAILVPPIEISETELYLEASLAGKIAAFRQYQEIMEADRFGMVCRSEKTGSVMQWHAKEGYPDGMPPDRIMSRMDRLEEIESQNEHVYLVPFSKNFHYIVADDLTSQTFAEMTGMGITPAIVMESSPGNFQAILKFPKNSEDDIEHTIANEIARTINIMFGDCSFSGAEHPHRAPGFLNPKSEYFVDGASPTAQIICAQNVMCDLLSDYSRWARRHMEKTYNKAADTSNETVLTGKQDEAIYLAHLNAVLKIMGITFADADMSAIDSIIAIRLRGTGHTKNSVADIIAAGGLATRPQKHNWPDYSARTANYAFGHAGNSQLRKYERWIPQWENIETQALKRLGNSDPTLNMS